MPFEYTDIEDEIVTRLVAKMPVGYVVMAMPQNEKDFQIGPKTNALIVVAYSDSTFDPPSEMGNVRQMENVSVLLNIKAANLRGAFGINEALRLIKTYLVGFKPSNINKLFLQKIEFDDRDKDNNFFSYNITFTGKKLLMEVVEDETLPLLTHVTLTNADSVADEIYSS